MQRLVWIVTRERVFLALMWQWNLKDDGTTEWCGEPSGWLPFT